MRKIICAYANVLNGPPRFVWPVDPSIHSSIHLDRSWINRRKDGRSSPPSTAPSRSESAGPSKWRTGHRPSREVKMNHTKERRIDILRKGRGGVTENICFLELAINHVLCCTVLYCVAVDNIKSRSNTFRYHWANVSGRVQVRRRIYNDQYQ